MNYIGLISNVWLPASLQLSLTLLTLFTKWCPHIGTVKMPQVTPLSLKSVAPTHWGCPGNQSTETGSHLSTDYDSYAKGIITSGGTLWTKFFALYSEMLDFISYLFPPSPWCFTWNFGISSCPKSPGSCGLWFIRLDILDCIRLYLKRLILSLCSWTWLYLFWRL